MGLRFLYMNTDSRTLLFLFLHENICCWYSLEAPLSVRYQSLSSNILRYLVHKGKCDKQTNKWTMKWTSKSNMPHPHPHPDLTFSKLVNLAQALLMYIITYVFFEKKCQHFWPERKPYLVLCLTLSALVIWVKFSANIILKYFFLIFPRLIVLGFNDTSTLVGHFVSSPREKEKRDRRDSRGDERERQGRKGEMKEGEGTEGIASFPLYPYLLQGQQALPNCKPISIRRPGDKSYRTPSPYPTTPYFSQKTGFNISCKLSPLETICKKCKILIF